MNANDLAKPDNEADRTITIRISGNRLVSVLNTLDVAMFLAGRYRFENDKLTADCGYLAGVLETTEAIRDELSRQRCTPLEGQGNA